MTLKAEIIAHNRKLDRLEKEWRKKKNVLKKKIKSKRKKLKKKRGSP